MHPKWIHPEQAGILWIPRRDVTGDALVEAALREQTKGSSEALLAVQSLLLDRPFCGQEGHVPRGDLLLGKLYEFLGDIAHRRLLSAFIKDTVRMMPPASRPSSGEYWRGSLPAYGDACLTDGAGNAFYGEYDEEVVG
jgi:hypothetical protein